MGKSGALPGIEGAFDANIDIIAAETYVAFGELLATGKVGADVDSRLRAAATIDAAKLETAEVVRDEFTKEVDALLKGVDAIILPTMPCPPLRLAQVGDARAALRMTALVRPFNLTGHPALTIPVRGSNGLPMGLQVVGHRGDDERVCAVGRMIEQKIHVIEAI